LITKDWQAKLAQALLSQTNAMFSLWQVSTGNLSICCWWQHFLWHSAIKSCPQSWPRVYWQLVLFIPSLYGGIDLLNVHMKQTIAQNLASALHTKQYQHHSLSNSNMWQGIAPWNRTCRGAFWDILLFQELVTQSLAQTSLGHYAKSPPIRDSGYYSPCNGDIEIMWILLRHSWQTLAELVLLNLWYL